MLVKIAMISIIGGILISYYTYKYYINPDEEESYLTKTYVKENESQCNNKTITHKKTYIKRIVIKKKIDNKFEKLN